MAAMAAEEEITRQGSWQVITSSSAGWTGELCRVLLGIAAQLRAHIAKKSHKNRLKRLPNGRWEEQYSDMVSRATAKDGKWFICRNCEVRCQGYDSMQEHINGLRHETALLANALDFVKICRNGKSYMVDGNWATCIRCELKCHGYD